ncbi:MAG: alanine/glycine:cation symporter family protein [Bacteroidota bacterium]
MPLLFLLLGGGFFFVLYSKFIPFKYFGHAINILRGKYDKKDDPGQINHFEALSTALSATVGMGNISGVAIAISTGGPGAIFWMWVIAVVGMATKFFTCTLAIMFRGKDSNGELQGGPMYVIMEGLGSKWKPLAILFCVAGLFGCLPSFQSNQLTAVVHHVVLEPNGWDTGFSSRFITGLVITVITAFVIFGGIKRIGKVASKMVPVMVVIYFLCVLYILIINYDLIPHYLGQIFNNAFTAKNFDGDAMFGGALGGLIVLGARRAAFSNEAGIGTAPMAHGAAKTNEPVREGLVAMLGPAIDTLLVCTLTALAILITDVQKDESLTGAIQGVGLTVKAFDLAIPHIGSYLLMICVLIFALSTLFTYSYYGTKCLSFLVGAKYKNGYNYFYIIMTVVGAVASMEAIESLISGTFALMAIPTMISAIILAPKVKQAAQEYFQRMNGKGI